MYSSFRYPSGLEYGPLAIQGGFELPPFSIESPIHQPMIRVESNCLLSWSRQPKQVKHRTNQAEAYFVTSIFQMCSEGEGFRLRVNITILAAVSGRHYHVTLWIFTRFIYMVQYHNDNDHLRIQTHFKEGLSETIRKVSL